MKIKKDHELETEQERGYERILSKESKGVNDVIIISKNDRNNFKTSSF